jgi:hypothetical protein
MDINHPLYSTLKDYYTNLDINSSDVDNNLLIQYIEDTYKIKADECDKYNFICLKTTYSKCDRVYFVNVKVMETTKLYCHFTDKLLNKLTNSDFLYKNNCMGKYRFIYYVDDKQYSNVYIFNNYF